MQASPAKLPDDTWGVRVYDPAHADKWTGQPVTVSAKGGKSWTSVLTDLVSFDGKSVALYRKAAKNGNGQAAPAAPAPAPTNLFETRGPDEEPAITDAMIAKHAPIAGAAPAPAASKGLSDEALSALIGRAAKIVDDAGLGLTANASDATRAVILSALIAQEV